MEDTQAKRVAFMLRQLGLLPSQNRDPWPSNGTFATFGQSGRPAQSTEPDIVRWAREQRERQKSPSRFPEMASSGSKPKPSQMPSIPVGLSKKMEEFLHQQAPEVDWSKVRTKVGGNRWGSYASTDGNMVSFSEPLDRVHPRDFFHEMAHIPDWQDGSLTTLKYIRDALLSAASYATKAGATYGTFGSPVAPADPSDAIWGEIPYEKAANTRAEDWYKAWYAGKLPK
ncbi:hypothetical protein [Rhizorhabdus histidinilytica]|uniref:hypothetical protein n=1 Tax=Rhizorhabdus histidinilytica TaxID=439228 RepID=UPI00322058A5